MRQMSQKQLTIKPYYSDKLQFFTFVLLMTFDSDTH
jgi:hypothetical protein